MPVCPHGLARVLEAPAGRKHASREVVARGQQLRVYLQEGETLGECHRQLENQVPAGVGMVGCGRREILSRQRQRGAKR
jgi:hypothetical protein